MDIEEMSIVQRFIDESNEYGLLTEIITTALQYMKDDPSLEVHQAMALGFNEWIK